MSKVDDLRKLPVLLLGMSELRGVELFGQGSQYISEQAEHEQSAPQNKDSPAYQNQKKAEEPIFSPPEKDEGCVSNYE